MLLLPLIVKSVGLLLQTFAFISADVANTLGLRAPRLTDRPTAITPLYAQSHKT